MLASKKGVVIWDDDSEHSPKKTNDGVTFLAEKDRKCVVPIFYQSVLAKMKYCRDDLIICPSYAKDLLIMMIFSVYVYRKDFSVI